ncbi:DegT/DnrJ/EryC1/StrS family aminotransferase [Candidatus Bathycorpusculum sp.]|uniref:DegT/DnrJ/EryC1/StrS family aminotransferase n=1 Tax=Candidatus Bathycorpusculum sp. TaxID=2994959 RepID=UPI00281E37F4|nr:DegT/DnrJ/EryC1/StrS family aminotransferase [Candidatus Termitimicrobium sp.]
MIPINKPQTDEAEVQAVLEVMRKGPLTNALGAGPKVLEFEKAFAEFAGTKHAVAVNTGTAALHAAVMAVGVRRDDEVILPSFTFVATAEAVALSGGKPVFVDIDPKTYNLSPTAVEKAITKKTKAILPVDLYGFSADMKPLREIADKHGLGLVEDAAQAHGATYAGKPVGSFADVACWSLYASKNMMAGEGGVITTNSDKLDEILRMIRTHGEKTKYASEMLGNNYRMIELQAAIANVQLTKLPSFVARRRRNAEQLTKILQQSNRLVLPYETPENKHSWYLYTARLIQGTPDARDKLLNDLKAKGIGAEAYYINPVNTMPFYRNNYDAQTLPETEQAAKQVFSLPIHPEVTEEEIEFIGKTTLTLL